MKILVTGSNGFIGKNLKYFLLEKKYEILEYNRHEIKKKLIDNLKKCDLIIHLAGENRPKTKNLFKINNEGLTKEICKTLIKNKISKPIIFSSTIHINETNAYALSKKNCEKTLFDYKEKTKAQLSILRLPNIYGKWAKHNYNSVIATFCHNLSRNKKIKLSKDQKLVKFLYIDDLVEQINKIIKKKIFQLYPKFNNTHKSTVKNVAHIIKNFTKNDKIKRLNNFKNLFEKNLYSTYVSYLPQSKFTHQYKSNLDIRGNFIEFIKSDYYGQVSIFTIKPKHQRGGHYHHSKVETFLIIQGKAVIEFQNLRDNKSYIKNVSSKKLNLFRSIPGWVHSIRNNGKNSLICAVWANEIFIKERSDTYTYKQ